jgi:membrane-associated phospholipid phosphatase
VRIRKGDLKYLIPIAAATAVSLTTDTRTMNDVVSHDANFNQRNVDVSNALVGGFIAAPVALFGVGQWGHNERARETGILGAEAMIDGFIVIGASKLIFFRERPYVDNARGEFFVGKSGADSSFASSHSVLAWSSAAVLADRYPSHWMQAGVYTLATGVSLTRVMGQQHFPTDVFVGAAAGWLIGHYVSRSHHRTLAAAK